MAGVYIGRDSNGKILRQYITKPTLKECKKAARELEEEIELKSLNNYSRMKMSDYMSIWFEANKKLIAPTTARAYKMILNIISSLISVPEELIRLQKYK